MPRPDAPLIPPPQRGHARTASVRLLFATILSLTPLLPGCTSQMATMSLASVDKAEDWPLLVLESNVTGEACRSAILHLNPAGSTTGLLARAIEDALDGVPDARVLTRASVELRTVDLLLYSRQCVRVHGNAARRARVIHVH